MGRGQQKIGTTINSMTVYNSSSVEKYTDYYKNVLIVIYPNFATQKGEKVP